MQACAGDCECAGYAAEPCKLRTPNSRRGVTQRRPELDVIDWGRPEDPFAYEPSFVRRISYGGGKVRSPQGRFGLCSHRAAEPNRDW
jgi:hypothetical protein